MPLIKFPKFSKSSHPADRICPFCYIKVKRKLWKSGWHTCRFCHQPVCKKCTVLSENLKLCPNCVGLNDSESELSLHSVHSVTEEKKSSPDLEIINEKNLKERNPDNKYSINKKHVHKTVAEICESVDLSISSNKLMDLLKKSKVTTKDMSIWACYGDSGVLFSSVDRVRDNLKTVVTYCETDTQATKFTKEKLRLVTKLLVNDKTKQYNTVGILLLLAAHGNVCNVQKEVGVNMAYSMMTNSVQEFVTKQSLQTNILRLIRDLRYLVFEDLYKERGFFNNTHVIVTVNNFLAPSIGIDVITDVHASTSMLPGDWKSTILDQFWRKYTTKRITDYIQCCIEDKKIPYQKLVKWFEKNCPKSKEKYEWLSLVIDSESGRIDDSFIQWMLYRMDILQIEE